MIDYSPRSQLLAKELIPQTNKYVANTFSENTHKFTATCAELPQSLYNFACI
jgi:hypothetical protein